MRRRKHLVEELVGLESEEGLGRMLSLTAIEPDLASPRSSMGDLTGLVATVRDQGVLQPILVRPLESSSAQSQRFCLICGGRRFQAARQAGLPQIPAIVLEVDEAEALEIALVENLARRDVTSVEPEAVHRVLEESHGELSESCVFVFRDPEKSFDASVSSEGPAVEKKEMFSALERILSDLRAGEEALPEPEASRLIQSWISVVFDQTDLSETEFDASVQAEAYEKQRDRSKLIRRTPLLKVRLTVPGGVTRKELMDSFSAAPRDGIALELSELGETTRIPNHPLSLIGLYPSGVARRLPGEIRLEAQTWVLHLANHSSILDPEWTLDERPGGGFSARVVLAGYDASGA